MTDHQADVLVIIGSIVGCSAAYYLAKRGASVILLERNGIGSGASGRSGGVLHQVEHPQIEAGRERLKELVTNGGSAAALRENAEEIIRLLDMHFGKEEQILFPLAEQLLDEAGLAEAWQKMESLRV